MYIVNLCFIDKEKLEYLYLNGQFMMCRTVVSIELHC
jgi:hypothetical protein